MPDRLKGATILVTGGAGFIGSNLCHHFLEGGNRVICLDNLSTGKQENIDELTEYPDFTFIKGDICDNDTCRRAVKGADHVFHQAALGSVPRSIKDPQATNRTNIDGFLNMLTASRDEGISRFIYAASSSTYGDSTELPKREDNIGRPLSPYAITKYVNELYASVYSSLYGIETIGLRYFNVFGRRQDPEGAYAAVIPLWVKSLLNHERPVINGDGSYSRDFTYIDNVIAINELAATTSTEEIRKRAAEKSRGAATEAAGAVGRNEGGREGSTEQTLSLIFNVAYGKNTTLNDLFMALRSNLSQYDSAIETIEPVYGPPRQGDIAHSLASIERAKQLLGYNPKYDAATGFEKACGWYYNNLRKKR